MAAGQGGGCRGLAAWCEARPIVEGGTAGVSGKRWVREWGFAAGRSPPRIASEQRLLLGSLVRPVRHVLNVLRTRTERPVGVREVRPEKATQRRDGLYKIPVRRVRCPDRSGPCRDQVPCSEATGGNLDSNSSSCAVRVVECSGQGGFADTLAGRRLQRDIAPSRGLGRREPIARSRAIHSKSDFIDIGQAPCGGVSLSHSCDITVAA